MNDLTVDLSNLRAAIGHDKDLERELFQEFINESETLLNELIRHCDEKTDNETWRQNSHALKGICFNLGATTLGDLCKQAQEQHEADITHKTDLLQQIKTEHQNVLAFLAQQS